MKELLTYHETSYFNTNDYFIMYNDGLKKYHVTKLELYGGTYYSLLGLCYKMTSVPCINHNEVKNLKIKYIDTEISGKISEYNVIDDFVGVMWESGKNIKKYGLPYHWNNPKNLKIIEKLKDKGLIDHNNDYTPNIPKN
jgi:hypothetical protein